MDGYRNIFQKWQTVCEHNSNKISTWISFVWCLAWLSCIHRIRLHFCICPERKGPPICILEKRYSCTNGICSDVFRKVKWPICRHIKTTRIYGAPPSRKGSLNQYHYKVFEKGYGPKTSAKHPLEKQKRHCCEHNSSVWSWTGWAYPSGIIHCQNVGQCRPKNDHPASNCLWWMEDIWQRNVFKLFGSMALSYLRQ